MWSSNCFNFSISLWVLNDLIENKRGDRKDVSTTILGGALAPIVSNSIHMVIVEPLLELQLSTLSEDRLIAGQSFSLLLVVSNNKGGSGNYLSTAYDCILNTSFDQYFRTTGVSAEISDGTNINVQSSAEFTTMSLERIPHNEKVEMTFNLTALQALPAAAVLSDNFANILCHSYPKMEMNRSSYPPVELGQVREYPASSNKITKQSGYPTAQLEVDRTSLSGTGDGAHTASVLDVAIGEHVVYKMNISVPKGSYPLNVSLLLDDALEYHSLYGLQSSAGVQHSQFSVSKLDYNNFFVNFGMVTNNMSSVDEDVVAFYFNASVLDLSTVVSGNLYTIEGKLLFSGDSPSDSTFESKYEIVETDAQLDYSCTPNSNLQAGDIINCTGIITNKNQNSADMFDTLVVFEVPHVMQLDANVEFKLL